MRADLFFGEGFRFACQAVPLGGLELPNRYREGRQMVSLYGFVQVSCDCSDRCIQLRRNLFACRRGERVSCSSVEASTKANQIDSSLAIFLSISLENQTNQQVAGLNSLIRIQTTRFEEVGARRAYEKDQSNA